MKCLIWMQQWMMIARVNDSPCKTHPLIVLCKTGRNTEISTFYMLPRPQSGFFTKGKTKISRGAVVRNDPNDLDISSVCFHSVTGSIYTIHEGSPSVHTIFTVPYSLSLYPIITVYVNAGCQSDRSGASRALTQARGGSAGRVERTASSHSEEKPGKECLWECQILISGCSKIAVSYFIASSLCYISYYHTVKETPGL